MYLFSGAKASIQFYSIDRFVVFDNNKLLLSPIRVNISTSVRILYIQWKLFLTKKNFQTFFFENVQIKFKSMVKAVVG